MTERTVHPQADHYTNPKAATRMVELPNGIVKGGQLLRTAEIREMTGYEEDILAGQGDHVWKLNRVISACVVSLDGQRADSDVAFNMVNADRMKLLLEIRALSLGDDYQTEAKCPHCGHKGEYSFKLSSFEFPGMTDPRAFEYPVELTTGRKLVLRAMTGHSELRFEKLMKKAKNQAPLTIMIVIRLVEVDGERFDLDTEEGLRKAAKVVMGMTSRERNQLREAMVKQEGKPDIGVDFTCEACGGDFRADLELSRADFFFPSEA